MKVFATLRDLFGRGKIYVKLSEDSNILDLILKLDRMIDKGFANKLLRNHEPDPNITILLNGREIRYLDGLNTKLKHEDFVAFVPPIAGG